MKAKNLQFLKDNGIQVPAFTVVTDDSVDLSFSEAERFAVRSTFDGEDTDGTSFAGQFDTLLNVPRDEVPAAVEQVRASYEKQNIAEYKAALGLGKDGAEECAAGADAPSEGSAAAQPAPVLVQEMVDADLAGVLFTANPTGLLNEVVVVVGEGLGDAVVEDRADTTTYYYNKDDKLSYLEKQGESPELPEGALQTLVETAQKVETLYGKPMDMEFAVAGEQVYFLQARPITTLSGAHPVILDSSNIVESYPGLTLPLSMSFAKDIYYEIFKALMNRATGNAPIVTELDEAMHDMVATANGRVYYRITSWYDVLACLPFSKKFTAIWQDMLGVENRAVDTDVKAGVGTKANMLRTVLKYLRITPKEMEALSEFYEEYSAGLREDLERIAATVPDENPVEAGAAQLLKMRNLLKKYHSLKGDIIPKWDITLMNDMYAFLNTSLAGERNKAHLSNLENLESMKPANAMNALAETAKGHGMDSEEYIAEKAAFIEEYGDRCLGELKLETRTYRTNPELVDQYVERLNKNAEEAETMTGFAPAAAPEVPPYTRNPFVKRAKTGIRNREISRLNRTRIYGFGRTIFTEIGNAMAALDLLDDPLDVFYLSIPELETYAFGSTSAEDHPDYRRLVADRKEQYEGFAKLPAYSRLVYDGTVRDKQVHNLTTATVERADVLYGQGASLGKVSGEVLVVEAPDLALDTTGKILVTHSTDPGWVFLIQNAAGIVAEKGSLLSHTAIITRELGKPAVVGVKDATRILHTGDRVEVDADSGFVRLLEY